ncbi:TetR family transcriptional regulator C-terminal domain-containing protein [Sporosarcina sp. G11-34]|uniref:TetR family transcriptional regulator C-terminal domain-containing protein n=1 Tax=Sporosarcina sp. G11-34 TaxID=2849605 RepID=UPI0022A918D6|nr:TetR family transcriptional regulator C-terminal domain-containing protein [Sporosarcina sp. G11-34]MCZ2259952.1 TetR family transcriptional regulator C-terminal domain-containing protein [Sporosarcina sp. G11-34]
MATNQLLKEKLDHDIEIERLYALIDGIAMHAMPDPKRLDKERVIHVIHYHINSICVE